MTEDGRTRRHDVPDILDPRILTMIMADDAFAAAMARTSMRSEIERLRKAVAAMLPTRPDLAGKVPLVLYFATRADADEFAARVKDAFSNPVEIVL